MLIIVIKTTNTFWIWPMKVDILWEVKNHSVFSNILSINKICCRLYSFPNCESWHWHLDTGSSVSFITQSHHQWQVVWREQSFRLQLWLSRKLSHANLSQVKNIINMEIVNFHWNINSIQNAELRYFKKLNFDDLTWN